MKKIISSLFVFFLILTSCQDQNCSQSELSELTPEQIGAMHNKYLRVLLDIKNTRTKSGEGITLSVEEIIDILSNQLEVRGHFSELDKSQMCAIFNGFDWNNPEWRKDSDLAVQKFMEYAIPYWGNTKSGSNDVFQDDVFMAVYKASEEFWAGIYGPDTKGQKNKGIVLFDALGSIIGGMFGPGGIVVIGAAASLLADDVVAEESAPEEAPEGGGDSGESPS